MLNTSMRKTKLVVLIIFLISVSTSSRLFSQSLDDENVVRLLIAGKDFFKAIENRDYAGIWDTITVKSKEQITKNIHKAQKRTGEKSTLKAIRTDFDHCAITCRSFWNAYLKAFDPNLALQESRWEIGFIKKRKAEILITHRNSERPAKLKMFRERGAWKVGLMETFWTYGTRRSIK